MPVLLALQTDTAHLNLANKSFESIHGCYSWDCVWELRLFFHRPGFVWCLRGRPAGSHRARCVPDAGNSWGAPVWCLWSRGSCPTPRPADAPDHTHCCSDVWFHHLLSTHSVTGSRKHTHTQKWAGKNKCTCSIMPSQKAINNKHGSNTPTHSLS